MATSRSKKSPKRPANDSLRGSAQFPRQATRSMGPPRLDKYERLLHLFFEPLILLFALGQTRGRQTPASVVEGSEDFRRKRFLDELSYVCDSEKGGPTTTAIAVEEAPRRYVFWYAVNKTTTDMGAFILSVLSIIRNKLRLGNSRDEGAERALEEDLTKICLKHAQKRIKKEIQYLRGDIETCKDRYLSQGSGQADAQLATWLDQFRQGGDALAVCSLAFRCRHDAEMTELWNRGRQSRFSSPASDRKYTNPFASVHHLIGRLAHHIRAPRRLLENADAFELVFGSDFTVCRAPALPAVKAPEPDGLTELPYILNRMGQKDPECIAALSDLDRMLKIQDRVMGQYQDPNFKPVVHAEIQVHELFNAVGSGRKQFVFDFPVIGCSKPACYCCKLYIQSHPARSVEPESHGKIWLNWSPPALPAGSDDPGFEAQRRVLQEMMKHIRREAVEQIMDRRGRREGHPDSTTGITKLVDGPVPQLSTLAQGFATLSIDQDPGAVADAPPPGSPGSPGLFTLEESDSASASSVPHSLQADLDLPDSDSDSDSDADNDGGGVPL